MVDLFSRETMLEFLPNRKMEKVCQTIMKRIIFSRGVPDELRSDNAPELMQGIVRQVCEYLDIAQIVTGGHNPRGNAICERVNQTLGAMIRKLSDLDYKDLKNFLPCFEFMINTTLSSATKRTPFEIAHGLPARTIAQARIEAQRVGRGATDPEILEDVSSVFDGSAVKHILEKAVEISEEVKAVSEWHRRMTHEGLNQKGQKYNLDHFTTGAKVYFYRPPSVLDVEKKTRKAKHIDHYVGPATIVKKIGSRSFQISFFNPTTGTTQLLQRDAGMIILKKEWIAPSFDPLQVSLAPSKHQSDSPLRAGEMVILMDYPDAKDWYVAEISQVLPDRFTVNGYITKAIPLKGYKQASRKERIKALKGVAFLRTWCKDKGKGEATNVPPTHLKGKEAYLWKWRLPVGEANQLLLVRNVTLDSEGCLCKASRTLAAALRFPHHVGAGGEESTS
jgi:transposase InsO family protein